MMMAANILGEVAGLVEGTPIQAKALLHLGSRAAVDQALSRLVRRGQLVRAGRGLYLRPIETRFGQRLPSVEAVLAGIQAETGETIAPSGAATANALGLTTQVPVRAVYLTSGPSRRFELGAQTVELRHAPPWQLVFSRRAAGEIIRALVWYGRERGEELTIQLRGTLSPETIADLSRARRRVPNWMAEQLSGLVASA